MKVLFHKLHLSPRFVDWWPVLPVVAGNDVGERSYREGVEYTWVDIPADMLVVASNPPDCNHPQTYDEVIRAITHYAREVISKRAHARGTFHLHHGMLADCPAANTKDGIVLIPWDYLGLLLEERDYQLFDAASEGYSAIREFSDLLASRVEQRGFEFVDGMVCRRPTS